jgi:hypothetical protein
VSNLSCYDDDEMYPDKEPDEEPDEYEEAMGNCHGWFEDEGNGAFMCGAVGSEDCDECPFYRDLGMTAAEVEDRDNEEICEVLRHEEWLKLKDFAP